MTHNDTEQLVALAASVVGTGILLGLAFYPIARFGNPNKPKSHAVLASLIPFGFTLLIVPIYIVIAVVLGGITWLLH